MFDEGSSLPKDFIATYDSDIVAGRNDLGLEGLDGDPSIEVSEGV